MTFYSPSISQTCDTLCGSLMYAGVYGCKLKKMCQKVSQYICPMKCRFLNSRYLEIIWFSYTSTSISCLKCFSTCMFSSFICTYLVIIFLKAYLWKHIVFHVCFFCSFFCLTSTNLINFEFSTVNCGVMYPDKLASIPMHKVIFVFLSDRLKFL